MTVFRALTSGVASAFVQRSAAILAVSLWSGAAMAETWTLYTPIPSSTQSSVKALQRIVDNIEKETGGELKIRIAIGGSLQIQANDVTQAVSDNVVQLADDIYFGGSIPIAGLLRLPGLARSPAEVRKVADILQPYIEAAYVKYNTTVMSTINFPATIFFGRAKITSMADLKGLKIRTLGPELTEVMKRMGIIPLPLSYPEIAPALERGIIDGLNAGASGPGWLMRDLVKYTYYLPFSYAQIINTVNTTALKKLSPKNQEILLRNFREGMAKTEPELEAEEADLLKKMTEMGIKFSKATPEEQTELENISKSYWEEWAKSQGPIAVEALGKVRAALGR